MLSYHRMLEMEKKVHVHKTTTWMGMYGARAANKSVLWSNHPMARALRRTMDRSKFKGDSSGVAIKDIWGKVSGGPKLKETQAYPDEYAAVIYAAWSKADYTKLEIMDTGKSGFNGDTWADAEMTEVARALGVPEDKVMH